MLSSVSKVMVQYRKEVLGSRVRKHTKQEATISVHSFGARV